MKPWLRRTGKALAILGASIAVLLIAGLAYVTFAWDRPVSRPVRAMEAPKDARAVARGRYLYNRAMLCWSCHGSEGSRDEGEPQAGGREFDMSGIGPGFGKVWGSNLTSDPETGLGNATDGEVVRAIREGIDRKGRVIFPVMAYQFYHGLSDDDALALVAYMRTFKPVHNAVPERELSFIAKSLIAFGVAAPEEAVTSRVEAPERAVTVEYGRYVAWHASGCAECHTPRFPENGQLDHSRLMGGSLMALEEHGFTARAPNLTPDEATGLGRWTEEQFLTAMRTGSLPDGTVMLPFMPWPSYDYWSDTDLRAVWAYLRSIAAVSHEVDSSELTGAAAGPPGVERGAGLFDVYCRVCHGEEGRGGSLAGVDLVESAGNLSADSLSSIVVGGGPPGSGMPGYGRTLTGDQIADMVAYLTSR